MSTASKPCGTEAARETSWLGADARALSAMNRARGWSLDEAELHAIQAYFKSQGREPTRAEVETVAQTWSEHCKHKTFTSPVLYRDGKARKLYKNLLADTVMAATRSLNKPWCLSVFRDNAGVVDFDGKWAVAFKVETHNHPCAVEPYGGAETGVGGVIRDVLGVGLGAKPILNTDIFCFCPPDREDSIPDGVLHPRRTMTGVVSGVRDYGNRLGIPTAAGAIWFDPAYRCNPLVFVGSLGLMPKSSVDKRIRPGDVILAIGGRTGRDGIHGATFSSADLDGGAGASVVQIGHAIMEKRVLDGLLAARDKGLYRAVTDCGAGGFSCAVGEMAADSGHRGGAVVRLERSLLKATDLEPWEIWVSESQERMVLAVPPGNLKTLVARLNAEGVECSVLGEFTDTGRLVVTHDGRPLVDMDLKFLHKGVPMRQRLAIWKEPPKPAPVRKGDRARHRGEMSRVLSWMLAHPNVCSREWVIRQYDHEVQGGTVIKPLQGLCHDGPGDGCVIWPAAVTGNPEAYRGIAVSHGLNPEYGKIDPYAMALYCVDEALSNLACVGADVTRAALLDNFCWGNPQDPEVLGSLVRAAQGCHDAALGFSAPFISGKDSFYNEYTDSRGARHQIPGTLLISAVAPVTDIRKCMTMDFKSSGNPLYLVGWTSEELGGSLFSLWSRKPEGTVPRVELRSAKDTLWALCAAAQKGLILTAHNLAEGGLAVATAEMAFSGEVGAHLECERVVRTKDVADEPTILFSESPSRFLLEVDPAKEKSFLAAMKGVPVSRVGATIANPVLRVIGLDGTTAMEEGLASLKAAWQGTLPRLLEGRVRQSSRRGS
jgi:phosphoribosylformylglycinamidine synthase